MLDEPDSPQSEAASNDLPTPPRGRRAASRPAGPPDPVVESPEAPAEDPPAPEQNAEAPEEDVDEPELITETIAETPAEHPADPSTSPDFERDLRARMEEQLSPRGTTESPETEASAERPRARRARRTASETADSKPARRRTRKQPEPAATAAESDEVAAAVADLESGAVSLVPAGTDDEHVETAEESGAGAARTTGSNVGSTAVEDVLDTAEAAEGAESDDESTLDDQGDDRSQDSDDDSNDEDGETGTRRRRRRRGGRRRRRGGSNGSAEQSGDDDNDDDSDDTETDSSDEDASGDDSADENSSGENSSGDDSLGPGENRRRRRRRRRRGEDTGGDDDPDTEVVVKVREPRRTKASEEVTGIEGSTRLEAKRQRRKEGRAAGRRRTPILSEAEFLARRESVQRTMVIRQTEELSQIAVLEDSILVEHYVDRASAGSLIGNVYLGRVQNVLPSMEAAFIDIGRGRNAVLYAGEVDWDSFGAEGQARKVEKVLKSGHTVLVQVTKDPVGAKGARLTNHISLPGRYIVYSPGGHLSGISRKLPDTERRRLKEILGELIGDNASVIVRTAAEGSSEDELVRDVNRLKAQWEIIEKKVKTGQAPQQLYAEPDATVRIVRDLFTEDFSKLVIDGNRGPDDAFETLTAYVNHVAPHLGERIERWDSERGDIFAAHRVDEQIAKALERKVFLPSGGSLVIDRTEAMTVIDVNTGKFTGSGGNLEATVTSNNLEAAEEVVRQLRLRDIGGIIVIDFIDMVLPSNRELLLRRLVECLGRDRTRHQVAEVTSLGLVQMTRKKIGTGLAEAFTETCECCKGRGYEIHDLPVDSQSPADGGDRSRRGRGRNGGNSARPDSARPDSARPDSARSERRRSRSGDDDQSESSPAESSGESDDATPPIQPDADQEATTGGQTVPDETAGG